MATCNLAASCLLHSQTTMNLTRNETFPIVAYDSETAESTADLRRPYLAPRPKTKLQFRDACLPGRLRKCPAHSPSSQSPPNPRYQHPSSLNHPLREAHQSHCQFPETTPLPSDAICLKAPGERSRSFPSQSAHLSATMTFTDTCLLVFPAAARRLVTRISRPHSGFRPGFRPLETRDAAASKIS